MLLFRKKKQELAPLEDCVLIKHIFDAYARTPTHQTLLQLIRKTEDEQARQVMWNDFYSYDDVLYGYSGTLFDGFKAELYGKKCTEKILNHIELSVCFLLKTRLYECATVIDILKIDKQHLQQVVATLERKLAERGCTLPDGYVAMQPTIRAFFEVDGKQ